jgi:SNF2 family DNA or RNA helicase
MFSIAFCAKSVVKLPKQHNKIIRFRLEKESEEIYNKLLEDGIITTDEGVLNTSSVIARILREQQITSGFMPVENDNEEIVLKIISEKRKSMLVRLFNSIPKDEPIVVFAKFKQDFIFIKQACEETKSTLSQLNGSIDTMQEWKEGKTRVLAVQYQSGAESISLIRAKYCVYYSLTHSLALYQQSKKRIHRPGQTRECYYYHIIGISDFKTIDENIMECLKTKQDIVDVVMKDKFKKS